MSFLRADLRRVRDGVRADWQAGGGLRGMPLAYGCAALVLAAAFVQKTETGAELIERTGVVRADLPLATALVRTPLSLFVPAPDLPAWGAVAQVLVVFGLAELAVGRPRTLLVALVATLAGTLYARVAGLDAVQAHVRDTGPSAAVVGLAMVLAWRWRSWLLFAGVPAVMVLELVLKPNLAGRQHLIAIGAVLLLIAAEVIYRRWSRGSGRS